MTIKTTHTGLTAWLGAGALAGLLLVAAPLATAEAQDTSATRQDTAAVQRDTSMRAAAGDTARADTSQWGRQTDREAEVQNPPGYRGMERPVNVFPPDSADTSSVGDATSRTSQLKRQDTISSENQNPPGYRGMERPVGTEMTRDQQAKWNTLLEAARKQPNPTPELREAINNIGDAEAQSTKKSGTKKKDKATKKATTTEKQAADSASASTVRVGEDTTGDTTRYEVNSREGRGDAGDSVTVGFDSTANNQ